MAFDYGKSAFMERLEFLRALNTIGKHFNHESVEAYWLMHGLPDGCTDDDLIEIADDEDAFRWAVRAFEDCVSSEEFASGDGFYFNHGQKL